MAESMQGLFIGGGLIAFFFLVIGFAVMAGERKKQEPEKPITPVVLDVPKAEPVPQPVAAHGTKECPFCKSQIHAQASICPQCHTNLSPSFHLARGLTQIGTGLVIFGVMVFLLLCFASYFLR